MNTKSNRKIYIIIVLLLTSNLLFAQANIENAKKYLENQIKQYNTMLLSADQQNVLSADIIEAGLSINLGNKYNNTDIASSYFIKSGGKFYAFESFSDLIQSEMFVKSLNPKFRLKTEDDAVQMRSLLFAVDKETRGKIFKKDNKWYIIKSDWFGSLRYFEFTTNDAGQILSVLLDEKEMEKPKETMGDKSNTIFKNDKYEFSNKDKKQIEELLNKSFESYKFDLKPINLQSFKSSLEILDGELKIIHKHGDYESSSGYNFVLLNKDKQYSVIQSKDNLITNEAFLSDLSKSFKIKDDKDAQLFEKLLDEIEPADTSEQKHYKTDNVWCFVRNKSFDDLEGVLVLVDKQGKILYIDDSNNINDLAILEMKIHDPNFKIDYAFKLVEPTNTTQKVSVGKTLPVKISFNADMVNATGGYIAVFMDGKMQGFSASSTMESPYTSDLDAKYFDNGKHTVQYVLLPSGEKEISKKLASVELNLVVEGGITAEENKQLEDIVNNIILTIQNNDYKKFSSYFVTQEQLNSIVSGIKDKSDEAKDVKAGLHNVQAEELVSGAEKEFEKLQKVIKDSKQDAKKIAFKEFRKKEQELSLSTLKALSVTFVYKTEEMLGAVDCVFFLTKDGIFLFEFESYDRMMPKGMFGY